jgi:6-phosphogluconolactonase (cycloisomerase 2 family)
MRVRKNNLARILVAGAVAIAIALLLSSSVEQFEMVATGSPQLLSIRQFPTEGEMCAWPSTADPELIAGLQENPNGNLFAALQQGQRGGGFTPDPATTEMTRQPTRMIRDTYPTYSYVAVDNKFDEVVLQDNNLWATRVFKRTANTPPDAPFTEPERVIEGPKTDIQFNNGIYIDPEDGEIYSVESDTGDKVVVFGRDAVGNVEPGRVLKTPHRGYALAVDEGKKELYVSVQYPPRIMVYRKGASGDEAPLRVVEGEKTGLSDVHGLAIDVNKKLMFVANWGAVSNYLVAGTGRFEMPSITVYPLDANGDVKPLRVIQGEKTQLNWPHAMSLDTNTGDLYVANDIGNSILVFHDTDQGDKAPARIIKGSKTGLSNPTGVFVDTKNKEVWAANFGNSSATCYSINANGDVAPLRTIRSAPAGYQGLKFGKVEAVAYDSKRDELLVPN